MAACRLASKGRSLADSSYDSEVASIKSFLSMQKPAHAPAVSINPGSIDPNYFLAPRYAKKLKGRVSVFFLYFLCPIISLKDNLNLKLFKLTYFHLLNNIIFLG